MHDRFVFGRFVSAEEYRLNDRPIAGEDFKRAFERPRKQRVERKNVPVNAKIRERDYDVPCRVPLILVPRISKEPAKTLQMLLQPLRRHPGAHPSFNRRMTNRLAQAPPPGSPLT